jgi:uncharacterized protein (TIGR00255 family)
MAKSMTGYGKGESTGSGYTVTVEMKGVNHRYFDMYLRTSRRYMGLEDRVKEKLKSSIARGRVEISLNIERAAEQSRDIKVDKDLAMAYYNSLKELAGNGGISGEIGITELFRLPEVFSLDEAEENLEALWQVVSGALDRAVADFTVMREKEGANLAADIIGRHDDIMGMVGEIEDRSPLVVRDYADRLKKRVSELLGDVKLDESRLMQEVAVFSDRANITEEIVRLKSHSSQLVSLLQSDQSVGRKCDFLVQEMFREINTIGSKSNDLRISQVTVDVKAELEKIREQIQNME